jgi:SAM-dependent methyltransferase
VNSYHGLHSRFYDLVYAEKPYEAEAAFVSDLLREHGVEGGRLLDVACGTGRHAEAFAAKGFRVTGVDYNAELVAVARARAPSITFLLQDMRRLDTEGGFDAVTTLFDSIGYPIADEGVLEALRSIRAQLRPDGILVAEFLNAPALRGEAAPVRVRRWKTPDGRTLVRISETSVDRTSNSFDVSYELLLLDENEGQFERWSEEQRNRAFEVDEMRSLLERAGFDAVEFLPAYDRSVELGDRVWHVLAVARPRTA